MTNLDEQFFLLTFNDIANWNEGKLSNDGILAEVPILQRGLVWEQSQIELLWDSILRGFPIGAMILCPINKSDSIRKQIKGEDSKASHFIIDGQQRYNAISLGFTKFPVEKDESNIIWLDLSPDILSGTRDFLVRLTTKAHPWGFNMSDDAGRLGVNMIRKKIIEIKGAETDFSNYKRPIPNEIFPFDANCPIPLSLLLNANEGEDFWKSVYSELQKFAKSGFLWAKKAFSSELTLEKKDKIQKAIETVKRTKIIALNMPDFLLNKTKIEEGTVNQDGITNIEHLFRRINSQGTILSGEELVYSMIKSHFPEIAKKIDDVAFNRMPSSRLVQLSIRLALSDENGLKGGFTVSQIRKLASSDNTSDKDKVMNFILNDLNDAANIVDKWLTNDETWGIPLVLKTGIAISSADVYCLLLYLAHMHPDLHEEIYKRITGIALLLHWFVDNKGKAVSSIYRKIYNSSAQNVLTDLQESLRSDVEIKEFMRRVQKPEFIEQIIDVTENNVISWTWDSCRHRYLKLQEGDLKTDVEKNGIYREYENHIQPILGLINGNRELLLYAQRNFLRRKFPDYDPARKDLWKNINRPWDFDHILPAAFVYNIRGSHSHIDICRNFYCSNGNLRAWPFEDNRSYQAEKTSVKIKNDNDWNDSFIDYDERDGYSDKDVIDGADKALRFAKSCKSRMIRIYQEWYNNFKIEELLE
jgi:hypothetical protein